MEKIDKEKIKSIYNRALYKSEKGLERVFDKHMTIGVTGLSGSGKSTFITSLVHQLINFEESKLPSLSIKNQGRLLGCKLKDLEKAGIHSFDYQAGISALAGNNPAWPKSTVDLSGLVLELRYKPRSSIFPGRKFNRLVIEIRDYPGEWLLDLPLLSHSFFDWSMETADLMSQAPRRDLVGNLRPLMDQINPLSVADETKIGQIYHEYVLYLQRCKSHGLSLIQPGRFLLPDQEMHYGPFFPVVMAGQYDKDALSKAKENSYYAVMKRAYDNYLADHVSPFYKEYFSGIDRQLILIDVLKTLNHGKASLEDLTVAMSRILDSFTYGHNNILTKLFAPKIDKVVLAASKIDQVLSEQHENIRNLTSALVRDIYRKTRYEEVDLTNEAVSAVRCTVEEDRALIGKTLEGIKGRMRHPDIPRDIPTDEQWEEFSQWQLLELQPPVNPGLKQGKELPHVRMDTVLWELIGDKFS